MYGRTCMVKKHAWQMCQAHTDTELEYLINLQFLASILIASNLKSVRNLQGTINLSEYCILDSL